MSLQSQFFDDLAQTWMPQALDFVCPDTCTIKAASLSQSAGGDMIAGTPTNAYTSVPCAYEPIQKFGWKKEQGERINSSQMYLVTLPTHTAAGTRINLDPDVHSIVVNARGNEPAKTFKILSIGDQQGVIFELVVSREG